MQELMVNLQSYVNKMTIVLAVDETTISDPHRQCDDIAESLELIKGVVTERGLCQLAVKPRRLMVVL